MAGWHPGSASFVVATRVASLLLGERAGGGGGTGAVGGAAGFEMISSSDSESSERPGRDSESRPSCVSSDRRGVLLPRRARRQRRLRRCSRPAAPQAESPPGSGHPPTTAVRVLAWPADTLATLPIVVATRGGIQ